MPASQEMHQEAAETLRPDPKRSGRGLRPWLALVLTILTFALFSPSLRHGFVNLDDGDYVYRNRIVLDGLTWPSVRLVFSRPHAAMYAPVLWLSYMLDVECFGTASASGFHFTNVLFHSLNAGLLFLLLFAWSRKPWRAFVFAACWAWHPLRVESVAWIAERKDVLSGFFFLLCLVAYGSAKRPGPPDSSNGTCPFPTRARLRCRGSFLASFVFFALGLLVKPSLVPVPALLLLLDFWPLRRFSLDLRSLFRDLPLLLLEKIPFFLLSVAASAVSALSHRTSDAVESVSLLAALKAIPIHYGFYLFKIFRPRNLTVLYPAVRFTRPDFLFALGLLAAISAWVWTSRRRRPNELVGWLWFLGLLIPVIGVVRFGVQTVADRFTYLPAMGISLAFLFALPSSSAFRRTWPVLRTGLAAGLLGLLAMLTSRALPAWQNTSALFGNLLRYFPDNAMALCHQAQQAIDRQGDFQAAETLVDRARLSEPASLVSLQIKALCLAHLRNPEAAYDFLRQHPPSNAKSDPGIAEWGLAMAAFSAKRYDETLAHVEDSLRLMPVFNYSRHTLFLLGMAAAYEKGDAPLALSYARRFRPYSDKTEIALPDLMPCYLSLWVTSRRLDAVDYFRRLAETCPDRLDLLNNAAWGLATADWSPAPPGEVLAFAMRAQALHPDPHPVLLDTLAAAQANAGNFSAAAEAAQAALDAIPPPRSPKEAELHRQIESRLQAYRRNEPYREDAFRRLWISLMP